MLPHIYRYKGTGCDCILIAILSAMTSGLMLILQTSTPWAGVKKQATNCFLLKVHGLLVFVLSMFDYQLPWIQVTLLNERAFPIVRLP